MFLCMVFFLATTKTECVETSETWAEIGAACRANKTTCAHMGTLTYPGGMKIEFISVHKNDAAPAKPAVRKPEVLSV